MRTGKANEFSQRVRLPLGIVAVLFFTGCSTVAPTVDDTPLKKELTARQQILKQHEQAESYYRNGDYERAQNLYATLVLLNEDDAQSHYRLAGIAFKQDRLDTAVKHFLEVLRIVPEHPKTQYNLAVIRAMQSEKHFKRYLRSEMGVKDPNSKSIYRFLKSLDDFSLSMRNPSVQPAQSIPDPVQPITDKVKE